MTTIDVTTDLAVQAVDITEIVRETVAKSGVGEGIVVIHTPHTTTGIWINEGADPDVNRDVLAHFSRMVPRNSGFLHAEGNSHAHISAILTGNSVTIPISDGLLLLGTWQYVFFGEFDGPRRRKVHIQVVGG